MNKHIDTEVAATLARRAMYPEYVGLESCISMSRMMCEILRYFGIEAKAVHASVMVFNKQAAEAFGAGTLKIDEPFPEWLDKAGGWTVGIGNPEKGGHVVGHVVVIANGELIDASLDQASRPEKGIILEPSVMPYDPEVPVQIYETPQGVLLIYKVFEDEYPEFVTKFKQSPDWVNFKKRYGKVAAKVIRQLKEQ